MLSHEQIWSAIDALAEQNKISVSRLARNAGLDPTTFNKSKREISGERKRWPSAESISKILTVTGTSWARFAYLVADDKHYFLDQISTLLDETDWAKTNIVASTVPYVPVVGFAEAGNGGFFDDAGYPTGHGWDVVEFPGSSDTDVYALKVSGDSMLPLFRDGDCIVVSPTAQLHLGDRVVVKTCEGEVLAKVLRRNTAQNVELESLNPAHPDRSFDKSEIEWIARIIWASQ